MTDTFTYAITEDFDTPYYSGSGSSGDVPGDFDVAINGRGYMADKNHPAFGGQSAYLGRMGIETIAMIRNQADNSVEPGEAAVNPEDLWPRSQHSWHQGAGQEYLDAPESVRARFNESIGVDVWTRNKASLLHETGITNTTTNTNLQLLRVGGLVYAVDGNEVYKTTGTIGGYFAVNIAAGGTPVPVQSITSDGHNIYAALGTTGVNVTVYNTTTSATYCALDASLIAYVKDRLMVAYQSSIYNITNPASPPSALFTADASDFTWVGFANGETCIYAAGHSGSHSVIYRTAVKPDGTALDVPVVAGELPYGETVASICGYLGFVLVGTDKGIRVAQADSSGNLTFGPLIALPGTVRCFEPQEQFVWFGWENFTFPNDPEYPDGTQYTALGRLDLSMINDSGAPAYASDLTYPGVNAPITSICTDPNGLRMFTAIGSGFVNEQTFNRAYGALNCGKLTYGLTEPKIALRISLHHEALPTDSDSVVINLAADNGAFDFITRSDEPGTTMPLESIKVPEVAAQDLEVQFVLTNNAVMLDYQLRVYPTVRRGQDILMPILLHDEIETASGRKVRMDVLSEYTLIESYEGSSQLVSYQELGYTASVIVEDLAFQRRHATADRSYWNGTLLLKLKALGD